MTEHERTWTVVLFVVIAIFAGTIGVAAWIQECLTPTDPSGCVCNEFLGECDVYVRILSDTMVKVWADASPEELADIAGITKVWDDGQILIRDPRHSWQGIVDDICALAEEKK